MRVAERLGRQAEEGRERRSKVGEPHVGHGGAIFFAHDPDGLGDGSLDVSARSTLREKAPPAAAAMPE